MPLYSPSTSSLASSRTPSAPTAADGVAGSVFLRDGLAQVRVYAPRSAATVAVSSRTRTANFATLTIAAHTILVGDSLDVAEVSGGYDATNVTVTAVTTTTVAYANTGSNEGATGCSGTVLRPWDSNSQAYLARYADGADVGNSLGYKAYTSTATILAPFANEGAGYLTGGPNWTGTNTTGEESASIFTPTSTNIFGAITAQVNVIPTEAGSHVGVGYYGGTVTLGVALTVTPTGILSFRRLDTGATLGTASGAGAVAAGNRIVLKKFGGALTGLVIPSGGGTPTTTIEYAGNEESQPFLYAYYPGFHVSKTIVGVIKNVRVSA